MTKARWWLLGSALLGSPLLLAALGWRLPEDVHSYVLASLIILIATLQFIGGVAAAKHLRALDGGSRMTLLAISSISAICWLLVLGFGALGAWAVSSFPGGGGFGVILYLLPAL